MNSLPRKSTEQEPADKMQELSNLARHMAHDMNNILASILGTASATKEDLTRDSPVYRNLETIIKACDRGRNMVRGLLEYTRTASRKPEELNLNIMAQEVVQLLELSTKQSIELRLDLEPDLPDLLGDHTALTHAIRHLVVNALDAMKNGGQLTIKTQHEDGQLLMTVQDSGTGMTPEVLERALDPFFTTKPPDSNAGLGLPSAYRTVQAHKGSMAIYSEPGKGTLVFVQFPVHPSEQAPQAAGEAKTDTPLKASQKTSVLLIDDDELIQSSMEALLRVMGFEAVIADCGEKALSLIGEGLIPDVVIMDMNMPGIGGAGTLPVLKKAFPEVPVLLATGKADEEALDLAATYSHVTVLAKPFGITELRKHLRQYLS